MASFSIITGIVVLIGSIMISKYQRIQESVLLRTLGAGRNQILIITALEYLFLGSIASATGIILALAASWAFARFALEADFSVDIKGALIIYASATTLTMLIGIFNTREVLNKAPLEVLRNEN
jgi:putative ABC transport system permease protein